MFLGHGVDVKHSYRAVVVWHKQIRRASL